MIIVAVTRWATFLLSLPERLLRAVVGAVGGAVHETVEVVLPRFARRSRLRPLREGFAAYSGRVARPYREALAGHFDSGKRTWTERALAWWRR